MTHLTRRLPATLVALVALVAVATPAAAGQGGRVGVAVGHASRFDDTAFSADFLFGIHPNADLGVSGEYIDDDGVRRYTVGAEVQAGAPLGFVHKKLLAWAGGTLAVVSEDPKGPEEATTRDMQASVLAGIGWDAPVTPFVQARYWVGSPEYWTISVGLRFH